VPAGKDGVFEYTSPDGKRVTIITGDGRGLSPEQAERIRKDAMAQAAHAREIAEWAGKNARISADQARRMADEARRSAQITREQAAAIRAQAMAEAGRAMREIRVFHGGPDGSVILDGDNARLRAQVDQLRDEVRQLRREVERLRRDR
jgi:polyhydroxyalkanoate synthesis regulator phasin